jgi:hypothetical protein
MKKKKASITIKYVDEEIKALLRNDADRLQAAMDAINKLQPVADNVFGGKHGRHPLVVGQTLTALRNAIGGRMIVRQEDGSSRIKKNTDEARRWKHIMSVKLRDLGIGESSAYEKIAAWEAAKEIVPENTLEELVKDRDIINLTSTKAQPFGHVTEKIEDNATADINVLLDIIRRPKGPNDKPDVDLLEKLHNHIITVLQKQAKKDGRKWTLNYARQLLRDVVGSQLRMVGLSTETYKAIDEYPTSGYADNAVVFPQPVVAAVTSNIVSTSVIPPPATKVSCCGCAKSDAGLVPYDGKAYCAACLPVGAVSPIKRTLVVQPPKQKAKRALIAKAGDSGCIVNNPAAVLSCGNSHDRDGFCRHQAHSGGIPD